MGLIGQWDLCVAVVTANRQLQTANRKLLAAPRESVMFRNLIEAINSNTEIIDEAVL